MPLADVPEPIPDDVRQLLGAGPIADFSARPAWNRKADLAKLAAQVLGMPWPPLLSLFKAEHGYAPSCMLEGRYCLFACPVCQPKASNPAPVAHALVEDHLHWRCTHCAARGTKFKIARLILEDADLLDEYIGFGRCDVCGALSCDDNHLTEAEFDIWDEIKAHLPELPSFDD